MVFFLLKHTLWFNISIKQIEDAWTNFQRNYYNILLFALFFAWVRLVQWRLVMLDPIKLLSLTGTGDKIFLDEHGYLFCPQCTCVLHSFMLMETSGNEMLFNFSSPCMSSRKYYLHFFFSVFSFFFLFSLKFSPSSGATACDTWMFFEFSFVPIINESNWIEFISNIHMQSIL